MRAPTLNRQQQEETTVAELPAREFSYLDRCERCGFQAFFVALRARSHEAGYRVPDGEVTQELVFCKHHGEKHTPILALAGWTVLDFTHMLNEKPSVSANAE